MEEYLIGELVAGIFSGLFVSTHSENFESGFKHLKRGMAVRNTVEIDNAIYEFIEIDDDDKLYMQVAAKFYLAICYCLKYDFEESKSCISWVENVEYDFFTLKKDTINLLKDNCQSLRQVVNECEEEYIRANTPTVVESEDASGNGKGWKILAICLIVVIVIAIVVGLVLFI